MLAYTQCVPKNVMQVWRQESISMHFIRQEKMTEFLK